MNDQTWHLPKKVIFRFAFIFILSFILLKNNGAFSFLPYITTPIVEPLRKLTYWFSTNILHFNYNYSVFTNGSSDTSYDWALTALIAVLAAIVTVIWSALDKNRKNYDALYYWLTTFIRYYIAFMLINYGAIKLVHGQMPPPGLLKLTQTLGEFSPMGLAWTYFGYSYGFNIFVGVMEILAGLLLFRKTMILGAMIAMAVSINIMSTNYFFDVPVKLISTALFLLSVFLLLPYFKSLFGFFIQGKPAQIKPVEKPTYAKAWINKALLWIKIILLTLIVVQQVSGMLNRHKLISQYFKKSTLYGIYHIENNENKRSTIPNNWMSIVFEYEGYAVARDNYYAKKQLEPSIDMLKKQFHSIISLLITVFWKMVMSY